MSLIIKLTIFYLILLQINKSAERKMLIYIVYLHKNNMN